MADIVFSDPVVLRLPGRGERKVATSFEALECLDREWPEGARGRRWRNAMMTCRDALDGWRSAREARRSFITAATRAGLLPRGRQAAGPRRRYGAGSDGTRMPLVH